MIVKEDIKQEVEIELERFVQELKLSKVLKVILFGSFARGDFNEASDIDIVVIKQTKERFLDRIGEVLALYQGRRGLEVLVYTPAEFQKMWKDENPFIRQLCSEGKVIYEQE